MPEVPVPLEETAYLCVAVDLPSDKKYHILGFEPDLDNINYVHHMAFYGCFSKLNYALSVVMFVGNEVSDNRGQLQN